MVLSHRCQSLTNLMEVPFFKYSGCSNDFILIDNRDFNLSLSSEQIVTLCDRREGIGADGVILVEPSTLATCKMRIFNADGGEAEMCGNGIRCVADFIRTHGHEENSCTIESMHRRHLASWEDDKYTIEMGAPENICWNATINISGQSYHLSTMDTGVPHAVIFCDDISNFPLSEVGKHIRYHEEFMPEGTNVNVVKVSDGGVKVRTYERGVEDETPACGTGATAAALVAAKQYGLPSPIKVTLQSGDHLDIEYTLCEEDISAVSMTGKCKKVFEGCIELTVYTAEIDQDKHDPTLVFS